MGRLLKCSQVEPEDSGTYKCISPGGADKAIRLNVLPSPNYHLYVSLRSPAIEANTQGLIVQVCTVMWTKSNPNSLKVTWRYPGGSIMRQTLDGKVRIRTYFSRLDPLIKVSELRVNSSLPYLISSSSYECRAQVGYRVSAALFTIRNDRGPRRLNWPGSEKRLVFWLKWREEYTIMFVNKNNVWLKIKRELNNLSVLLIVFFFIIKGL